MKKSALTCAPRTAVAYARYSSAGQRDVSIEQQLQDIRAYAEREGYTIVHEYADHARSGFRNVAARTEFQAMMAAAGSGSYDTVLCWKVDRFGRSREDSAIYKGQLSRLGISVVYVMEPIPEGAAGVLTEGMLEAIAEWYSRNLSENVKRGMNDNARNCLYNGSNIYGYTGRRNQRYVINDEQAAVVRRVFSLYADGYSMVEISRMLKSEGCSAFTFNKIYRILNNERYLGIYIFGDIRIPGGMPAIIDQETWEKAQRMKEKTGRHYENSPVEFLLTGKAFCGHCGKPMVGDSGTSKTGAPHYYYTCQSKKRRAGCSKKSVRKEKLEDCVISFLLDHVLSGPMMEQIADMILDYQKKESASSPLRAMEKELADVERKISNTNRAIAEGIFSGSTVSMLRALENSAASLRLSIESRKYAEGQLLDRDRILFFLTAFSNMDRNDPRDRRTLIRVFLNSVYVYDDYCRILVNTSENDTVLPFENLPESSDPDSSGSPIGLHPNIVIHYIVRM